MSAITSLEARLLSSSLETEGISQKSKKQACSQLCSYLEKTALKGKTEKQIDTSEEVSQIIFDTFEQIALIMEGMREEFQERSIEITLSQCKRSLDLFFENQEFEQRVENLYAILMQVGEGIIITDADKKIIFINQAGQEISGYTAEEVIGKNPSLFKNPQSPEVYEGLRTALKEAKPWRGTFENRRKNGDVYIEEITISPIKDNHGKVVYYFSVKRDITERVRMEESLRIAKEQAEASMRAQSAFLANVSHELRTPLNAIIGFSEIMMLAHMGHLDAKYQGYAEDIFKSGSHLLAIINDLLDHAKLSSEEFCLYIEDIDIKEIANDCIKLVQQKADEKKVQLKISLSNSLSFIRGDNTRVRQIILNLLSNAVKFTKEGGTVCLHLFDEKEGIVISIEDTGIGMNQEDLKKALTPFGQAASVYVREQGGTGLGLPITKKLVELHGGSFTIESTPGKGTTVQCKFPRIS